MTIRDLLPGSCIYQPMDCVQGCDDTIIVDFNKNIIPDLDRTYDYAVCSGVMEYVDSPRVFLGNVIKWADLVILTYAITDMTPDINTRRNQGWFNDLSFKDLMTLLSELGIFSRYITLWQGQVILELK